MGRSSHQMLRIAIHDGESFSKYWIDYCIEKEISYKIVNCYDNNIIQELEDCDALMFHHHQGNYKDELFAKQLLYSLEQSGKIVFPDYNTNWHFDDKIGQKYLLEVVGAPFVNSKIFYSKDEALKYLDSVRYPFVFKLRGGAGSSNVKLINNRQTAIRLIKKAFGKGYPSFDKINYFKERINKYLDGRDTLLGAIKGAARIFIPVKNAHLLKREMGYFYSQEFIPNNSSDTRIITIDNKAFAIKRFVRKNDFRASGSGNISYSKNDIDTRCLEIAFKISSQLKFQCIAYDFVFDSNNDPLILEISYGFKPEAYWGCPGFWDNNLHWYEGEFNRFGWMVDLVINQIKKGNPQNIEFCNPLEQ